MFNEPKNRELTGILSIRVAAPGAWTAVLGVHPHGSLREGHGTGEVGMLQRLDVTFNMTQRSKIRSLFEFQCHFNAILRMPQ